MPTTATLARIDRLRRAFSAVAGEHSDAERWRDASKVEALATAMKLLDACICIEESAAAIADARDNRDSRASAELVEAIRETEAASDRDVGILRRLREIALERDIFGERRSADEAAARAVETGALA